MTMALEELHSKVRASEREKHEALQRLESVQSKLKQEQNSRDLERHQFNEQLENNFRRLRRVEQEFQETKNKEIALEKRNSSLEHEKNSLLDQLKNLKMSFESQQSQLETKYESRIEELQAKIENLNESNANTSKDLQRMISSQRVLSEKWYQTSKSGKKNLSRSDCIMKN
jgi:chromosome segregation ATPase